MGFPIGPQGHAPPYISDTYEYIKRSHVKSLRIKRAKLSQAEQQHNSKGGNSSGQTDGRADDRMVGRTVGRTVGRADGRSGGRTDGRAGKPSGL